MPLSAKEKKKLAELLQPWLETEPAAMLEELYGDAAALLPPYDAPQARLIDVVRYLGDCDDEQLRILLETFEDEDVAAGALARLRRAGQDPVSNPFDSPLVWGTDPFFARDILRSHLKELADPGSDKRILLVHSDQRRIGKSFSGQVIRYAAANPGVLTEFNDSFCDVAQGPGGAGDLAEALARGIDVDAGRGPEKGDSTDQFWRNELVKWVLGLAEERPGTHWIVIDSIARIEAPTWMHAFVNELALGVRRTVNDREGPRLVLLDHPNTLPLTVQAHVLEERLSPVDRFQLRRYLEQVLSAPAPDAIDEAVERLEQVDDGPDRLEEIQYVVRELIRERRGDAGNA